MEDGAPRNERHGQGAADARRPPLIAQPARQAEGSRNGARDTETPSRCVAQRMRSVRHQEARLHNLHAWLPVRACAPVLQRARQLHPRGSSPHHCHAQRHFCRHRPRQQRLETRHQPAMGTHTRRAYKHVTDRQDAPASVAQQGAPNAHAQASRAAPVDRLDGGGVFRCPRHSRQRRGDAQVEGEDVVAHGGAAPQQHPLALLGQVGRGGRAHADSFSRCAPAA